MSERYVEAAAGEAQLVTLEGAGHFEPIDPLARQWPRTLEAICRLLLLPPPLGPRSESPSDRSA